MRNRATTPLSKAKVRQSWNKYNLYNLSRLTAPPYRTRTFFQQKWTAKSLLRAYHGEQVREGQWERMFSRRLRSVVPMSPEYLARNDGSLESAGRGSGLEIEKPRMAPKPIPYMQMTFAPLERRLDTAIFRAMFASSARQARQFVVHGAVKVNGKNMRFPGYLLNPGDMFQVDPERVMFATGVPKLPSDTETPEVEEEENEARAEESVQVKAAEEVVEPEEDRDPRVILKDLLSQAKTILAAPREKLGAKRKQDFRAFSQAVKRMLSRSRSSTILTDSLEAQFLELQNQLNIQHEKAEKNQPSLPSEQASKDPSSNNSHASAVNPTTSSEGAAEEENSSTISDSTATLPARTTISKNDYDSLFAALTQMNENPVDDSKPYATPWIPRDYMSAFAFIPRYLEVNHNICAAVYLRHPVARPGMAEVPTPYGEGLGSTAFAWYLRRR